MPSDIQSLGFHTPISSPTRPVTFPAMADTGCQSCLAGLGLLTKMGLNRRHLLPVKIKMTAANHGAINIVGALALRISGTSPTNKKMNTRQMVYFTTATDRMFLSKQACIALGMIPPSFPTIGETGSANCPLPPTPKATNSKAPVTGLARALRVLMPHNAPGLKEQAARPRIDPSPVAPRRSARLMNPAHTPA
ncbi:hypothetical protein PoB_000741900 [Plakobranchus ocellatus]|uniref:Uncharacterized protein n=1 Tax=Plakobranchus ocellatus TaxID=259542 RepID=A0AAV3YF50_9GAST|nr:hypothetical protein PoB_000741900 [Plakobranchus ocellatus]